MQAVALALVEEDRELLLADDLAGAFVIIAMLYCAAIVILAMTRTNPPEMQTKATLRLREVLRESPTAVVGALVTGSVTTILLNVYPYRASQIGLSAAVIAAIAGIQRRGFERRGRFVPVFRIDLRISLMPGPSRSPPRAAATRRWRA